MRSSETRGGDFRTRIRENNYRHREQSFGSTRFGCFGFVNVAFTKTLAGSVCSREAGKSLTRDGNSGFAPRQVHSTCISVCQKLNLKHLVYTTCLKNLIDAISRLCRSPPTLLLRGKTTRRKQYAQCPNHFETDSIQ